MSLAGPAGLNDETSRKDVLMSEPRTVTEPRTETLDVPGARLRYDVRDAEAEPTAPPLLMIALPMDATGFTTLAGHFRDRTVVTYDPRGIGRSERTDGATASTADEHADDVHRLISALDAGPVDIFGSSGGAVTGLVLVARHPEHVRTLVAHEPPAASLLPDGERALAALGHIRETYRREGFGPAMAKFMVLSSLKGPIPADFAEVPTPNPAEFGLPIEDDGSRDDPLLGHDNGTTRYEHDFDALRAAPTRIVVGAGAESEGEMAHRAALAVAERLGTEPVIFPSHHGGFLGGEFGWRGEPEAFAVTLRDVLVER
jgi:pimeloyl-ACP methyl ester carboxylesterase